MDEKKVQISVIIPTYNRAKLLPQAIESVLNQTFQDFELIIVDDGSTDNTEEIVKNFQEKDKRIKYLKHQKNKGPSATRNTGIKNSQGKYIAFLDADDIWLPQKIEIQLNKIKETNVNVIFSNWYIWNPKNNTKIKAFDSNPIDAKQKNLISSLVKKNFGNSSAILANNSLFKKNLFDENLRYSEDYDLWFKFFLKRMKIVFITNPLVCCREHNEQTSKDIYQMRLSRLFIFKKIIKENPNILIKSPILLKKIILLWGYKLIQDFLKIFKKKKKYA